MYIITINFIGYYCGVMAQLSQASYYCGVTAQLSQVTTQQCKECMYSILAHAVNRRMVYLQHQLKACIKPILIVSPICTILYQISFQRIMESKNPPICNTPTTMHTQQKIHIPLYGATKKPFAHPWQIHSWYSIVFVYTTGCCHNYSEERLVFCISKLVC